MSSRGIYHNLKMLALVYGTRGTDPIFGVICGALKMFQNSLGGERGSAEG